MPERPIRQLENLSGQAVDVDPLPAPEVRRRGDRLRRRNHLLAGVGAVAAVVVIATPLALGAADRDDAAPPPVITEGPTPTETVEEAWVDTIPPRFPLAAGFPEARGNTDVTVAEPSDRTQALRAAGELTACGAEPEAGEPLDRLTTRFRGPAEVHARELQVFADDTTAAAHAASVREVYTACPEESDGGPGTITTDVSDTALGEESFVTTRDFSGTGRVAIHVVRVGNAVLVDLDSDEGTDAEASATENEQALGDVVEAMELFSEANLPPDRG